MSKPLRFDEIDGEDEELPAAAAEGPLRFDAIDGEEMGTGRALARGAGQGASLSLADEGAGLVDAVGQGYSKLFRGDFEVSADGLGRWYEDFVGEYRKGRDEARSTNAHAEAAHPTAYLGGQVAGGVGTGILTAPVAAGAAGLKGALLLGAAEGGLAGLGGSDAELTTGDVEQYARAGGDALTGAGTGALFGAGGYGAGKGLQWLGGKAKAGLSRARGALVQGAADEERAALQAVLDEVDGAHGGALEMNKRADAAAQRQAEREAERLARAQGQGLEMDKRLGARSAAEAEAEAERLARAQGQAMEAEKARAARLAREQGQGLEMNKRLDAASEAPTAGGFRAPRAAPAEGAGLQRSAGIPEPRVAPRAAGVSAGDLDTKVMRGYQDKSFEHLRGQRGYVAADLENLKRPDLTPEGRAEIERYLSSRMDALNNPDAFRLNAIRRWLGEKFPGQPDMVEELMQRFDSRGMAMSRGAVAERAVTQVRSNTAVGREVFGEQVTPRNAGGGGGAFDGWHEAPTGVHHFPEEALTQPEVDLRALRPDFPEVPPEARVPGRPSDPMPEYWLPDDTVQALTPAQRSAYSAHIGDQVHARLQTGIMDPRAPRPGPAPAAGATVNARPGRAPAQDSLPLGPSGQRFASPGGEVADRWARLQRGERLPLADNPGSLDAEVQAAVDAGQVRSPADVRAIVDAYGFPGVQGYAGPPRSTPPGGSTPPRTPVHRAIPVQGPQGTPPGAQAFAPRLPPEGYVSPAARAAAKAAEAGAGMDVLKAGYRGFAGARNGLAAPLSAAVEVGKEAFGNPAVRARVLAASRLERLASTNPALYGRVGASLAAALQKGPDEYAVTRHVLLQTEPEYRQAEAQADEEQEPE